MTGTLFGLAIPALAVWVWIRASRLRFASGSAAVAVAIALCGGIGLSSVVTFWVLAAGGSIGGRWFAGLDALGWTAVTVAGVWRLRRVAPDDPRPDDARRGNARPHLGPTGWLVRGTFGLTAAMATATAAAAYLSQPHGDWDAWAIWNQKARFLLRGGPNWTEELLIGWSNPAHPLLVPAAVARLWAYAGAELTIAPAILALSFGTVIVLAVMGTLNTRRQRAWIAGAVLLAPAVFIQQVAAQQADVPLAAFMVATFAVLRQQGATSSDRDTRGLLLIAGALASLAAWTKNEGLVFLVITGLQAGRIVARTRRVRLMAMWAAGAAPVLLTVAWLKEVIAPGTPVYLPESNTFASIATRVLQVPQHVLVGGVMWQLARQWGGPVATGVVPVAFVAAVLAATTRMASAAREVLVAVVLMLIAYYGVYLMTPLDTKWLVSTSFVRLLTQIWPLLVLAAFSWGRSPAVD